MMQNIMRPSGVALALAVATFSGAAFAALPVTGNWLTEDDQALVRIAPCGSEICGKIVKVLKPVAGHPTTDIANPDPRQRHNPIEGTFILTEFVDSGTVWKGKIYNPETGKTYKAKLARNPDGTLKVEGCIAFMCKGPIWTRAR